MLSKEQNEKIFDGQIAHSSTTSQYIFAYFTFFRVSSTYKVIVKKKNFLGRYVLYFFSENFLFHHITIIKDEINNSLKEREWLCNSKKSWLSIITTFFILLSLEENPEKPKHIFTDEMLFQKFLFCGYVFYSWDFSMITASVIFITTQSDTDKWRPLYDGIF